MYINVLTQIGAKAVDQNYIYSVPKELQEQIKVGIRVKISFGKIIVFLMIILAILFAYPILSITILITCYVLFGPSRALYYLTKHFMEKRK